MAKDLNELWETIAYGRIRFVGTKEQFDEWRKEWYAQVPKCHDFTCIHDSMSCGIGVACGDCSKYDTMASGNAVRICTFVDCADCTLKHTCDNPLKYKTRNER